MTVITSQCPQALGVSFRLGELVDQAIRLYVEDSPFGFLPPLVPMLESQNLLDVQSVFTSATVPRDLVDQHRDLWDWRIHPVQ